MKQSKQSKNSKTSNTEFIESQYWEMYGIKKPHTGIKDSPETNKVVCPFLDLVYPRWKGVAHELGYCEALHFKVMMPKSVVESKCKLGGHCDYKVAGIKKDEAIVKGLKAKRRRRSTWGAAKKLLREKY